MLRFKNNVEKRWKSEIVDRGCVISSQEHLALKITHSQQAKGAFLGLEGRQNFNFY